MYINLTGDNDIAFEEDGVIGRRSVLPGGIRLLTEHVPGQRSVSLALWVGAGSGDEAAGREGSTHFLEHLLFKGTGSRSAEEISKLGDFLGGTLNAATARQYTTYYGRVFSGDMPQLLELLIDMFTSARLAAADMELERGVILEELAASDDDVSERAETAVLPLVIGDHPLARPIGGTFETVGGLAHSHLLDHYREYYQPNQLVVTAAGDVDHDELASMIVALTGSAGWDLTGSPAAPQQRAPITYTGGNTQFIEKPGRQSAVVVAMPGVPLGSHDEPAAIALEYILGGGQSSRLFTEIREERGLAYSAFAWSMAAKEGAVSAMEAHCAPDVTEEVAAIMGECLEDVAANGVTDEEVEIAYRQRRAQLVFAAESNSFRRDRLGQSQLVRGQLRSIGEMLTLSRAVTAKDVQDLAVKSASGPRSQVTVGPAS